MAIIEVIVCGFKDLESHPSRGDEIFLILAMSAEILGNLILHWMSEVVSVGAKLPECIECMTIFVLLVIR
jgi:hypothetical protein